MTTALPHRPAPLVLAAPSGTGKTTIAHALVERYPTFVFSVSATTRPPREGERDGVDYQFVTPERFQAMIRDEELVEWARVHGNMYGTPRRNLAEAQDRGEHVVLDIDVQGAEQIRERVPEAILVFVLPPSPEALLGRLTARGTEEMEEVKRRLRNAREELERAGSFHYVVVNDDLERAIGRIRGIVEAEGHRPGRALDLAGEVARIRTGIDDFMSQSQQ